MIVRRSIFADVVAELSAPAIRAVDTETTGLNPWLADRLFSIIIGNSDKAWYFNFQQYPGLAEEWTLPRKWLPRLRPIFDERESVWRMHNAKFDLGILAQDGIEVAGKVHCTEAIGRVQKNNRFNYKLDGLLKEIGREKLDIVKEYVKKHKLYRIEIDEETGEEEKIPCFDKVPFEIIVPYGEADAIGTWHLGEHQAERIQDRQNQIEPGQSGPRAIMQNEMALTKTCFEMERAGVLVDRQFSKRALTYEQSRMSAAQHSFKRLTGLEFNDHSSTLAKAFDAAGERYPLTAKGNPSFRKDVLQEYTSPVAQIVLDYRNAQKRANTYFLNFLKYADPNGYIHPNMRQSGTEPGRMSYSNPNFQNLPKRGEKREHEFNVRRAVIPSPGNFLGLLDYDQMEYRLMLDYAREMGVITQVIGGMDVHEATAHMMSVARDPAKTLNFMLLYGGGVAKLCVALFKPTLQIDMLKELVTVHFWKKRPKNPALYKKLCDTVSDEVRAFNLAELMKARELQEKYFSKLPRVKEFTDGVTAAAKSRGYVKNWAGRICYFSDPNHAYAAPNHLIQGGCADIVKIAMNNIVPLMRGRKSKMILQVHDELIFDMHPSERHLLSDVKGIMESAYPHKHLPLTVGIDHSWKSWADKEEGIPA